MGKHRLHAPPRGPRARGGGHRRLQLPRGPAVGQEEGPQEGGRAVKGVDARVDCCQGCEAVGEAAQGDLVVVAHLGGRGAGRGGGG